MSLYIKETFIGSHPLTNHTGNGFKNVVTQFLEENNIDFTKCRGQAYDGCSVMSGQYNGLQAKLFLRENKYAKYMHCASHSLNLVLNDAVHGVLEAKEFFDTV